MIFCRQINSAIYRPQGCVLTIGAFDGMHLGHQEILQKVKEEAKRLHLQSTVITFEPLPGELFFNDVANARLMTLGEKLRFLAANDINNVLCLKFNAHLASYSAQHFVEKFLIQGLNARYVIIGDDFHFGHNRSEAVAILQQYQNIQIEQMPSYIYNGLRVSSTHIREALAHGNLKLAAELLGRPYTMSGTVAHGNKLGQKLGFPTANIYLKHKVLPLTGVYVIKAHNIKKEPLSGIANIGTRPTIAGKSNILEAHLLNFEQNLYGKKITVEFVEKIRAEKKFSSLEELQQNIRKDIRYATK